jgi:glycosyltransferase involved in cell wall biosynthesis
MNSRLESTVRNFLERQGLLQDFDSFDLKNLPFVTVGVCVKNSERTISECLKSIVNSDYDKLKLEIIVVDGKSVDNTLYIVRDILEKSRIAFKIFSDEGKGLAYARQIAFERAKGEYILWIDGDNAIPTHFIKRHIAFMERSSNIGASSAVLIPRGSTIGARLQVYQYLSPFLVDTTLRRLNNHNRLAILGIRVFESQGVACRVVAMKSAGGYDTRIAGAGEDVDLLLKMQFKGWKIGETPNTWIYHYVRSDWKSILRESIWMGYGKHYLSHKYPKAIGPLVNKRTAFGLLDMIERTLKTAKLFKDYAGFLMPLYYLQRRVGFMIGYRKAHNNGYGHNLA